MDTTIPEIVTLLLKKSNLNYSEKESMWIIPFIHKDYVNAKMSTNIVHHKEAGVLSVVTGVQNLETSDLDLLYILVNTLNAQDSSMSSHIKLVATKPHLILVSHTNLKYNPEANHITHFISSSLETHMKTSKKFLKLLKDSSINTEDFFK